MSSILDLEIFVKVADAGNMSAAGRELGLSPAVVSKHMSALEDKLKVRLFERTTRQLSLTEQGERYYEHVVKALKQLQLAAKNLEVNDGEPQGTLKLTAPTIFARLHLGQLISEFLNTYKRIDLDVNLSDEVTDISSQGYDVAIRIGIIKDQGLLSYPLASNHRVLCAHPSYLKQHGVPNSLQDLKKHNCLILKSQDNWVLSGPKGKQVIQVSGNLSSNSSDFIHEAALAGDGIALRSTWEISKAVKNGDLNIVLPEYVGLSDIKIHIVYPMREIIPAKVDAFVNFTRQKFKLYNQQNDALTRPYE